MEYIIIIAVIIVILAILFLRKGNERPSDYEEPVYKASGHQWVFNGILDIDCPPADMTPFMDYEGDIQLMVKKGFVHYDLIVDNHKEIRDKLGLFHATACVEGERIVIRQEDAVLGCLPSGLNSLQESISQSDNEKEAYGYIARKNGNLFGEVCVRR